jgi:hypothetical protein
VRCRLVSLTSGEIGRSARSRFRPEPSGHALGFRHLDPSTWLCYAFACVLLGCLARVLSPSVGWLACRLAGWLPSGLHLRSLACSLARFHVWVLASAPHSGNSGVYQAPCLAILAAMLRLASTRVRLLWPSASSTLDWTLGFQICWAIGGLIAGSTLLSMVTLRHRGSLAVQNGLAVCSFGEKLHVRAGLLACPTDPLREAERLRREGHGAIRGRSRRGDARSHARARSAMPSQQYDCQLVEWISINLLPA